MASVTASLWDHTDGSTVENHLDQVESYFVTNGIEAHEKQVACLHLSLKGEAKVFLAVWQLVNEILLLTRKHR